MVTDQSYPFLAVALAHGADYGDVMLVAEHFLRRVGMSWTQKKLDARERLSQAAFAATVRAAEHERWRREH